VSPGPDQRSKIGPGAGQAHDPAAADADTDAEPDVPDDGERASAGPRSGESEDPAPTPDAGTGNEMESSPGDVAADGADVDELDADDVAVHVADAALDVDDCDDDAADFGAGAVVEGGAGESLRDRVDTGGEASGDGGAGDRAGSAEAGGEGGAGDRAGSAEVGGELGGEGGADGDSGAVDGGGSNGDADPAVDPGSAGDLIRDLERVSAQRDQFLDTSRRIQAEFENYRKQVARREVETRERAAESLVAELLPVLDACDHALASGASDVEPVRTALVDVLTKQGLARIDTAEELFDPSKHDAVLHEPGDDAEPVVAEIMRAGYSWNGRVVRPAMVRVRGG
jgi:molecular chaperone GrpE